MKSVCMFYNCYKNVLKSPLLYRDIPVTTVARPPPYVYFAMNTLPGNRGVIGGFTINEGNYLYCVIDLYLF